MLSERSGRTLTADDDEEEAGEENEDGEDGEADGLRLGPLESAMPVNRR